MTAHDKFCPCSSRADKRQCRCAMLNAARADERERIADLLLMKFSMTSARIHGLDGRTCVCHLCAINSIVDAAVDWLRGEQP